MTKTFNDLSKQIINGKIDIEAFELIFRTRRNEINFEINNWQIIKKESRIRMKSEENNDEWYYKFIINSLNISKKYSKQLKINFIQDMA